MRPHQEAIEPALQIDASDGFVVVCEDDFNTIWQLFNRLDSTIDIEFLK